MKELDMMHYFLGMEVWQNADGSSLGQGMMDHTAITTPMESNLKLLSDASLEAVDAMMYQDPNPRLYQAPRGIKSPEVQTSFSAIPEKRFAPREI